MNKQKTFDDEEIDIDPEIELDIANKPWKRRKVLKYRKTIVIIIVIVIVKRCLDLQDML